MMALDERIGRVINTPGFKFVLDYYDVPLFEFQLNWGKCNGDFDQLPYAYRKAIEAGESCLK